MALNRTVASLAIVAALFIGNADVPAVLDQLEIWNRPNGHVLEGRLDLMQVSDFLHIL
jgi:hypothetical protein